jgi:hypothetical protein
VGCDKHVTCVNIRDLPDHRCAPIETGTLSPNGFVVNSNGVEVERFAAPPTAVPNAIYENAARGRVPGISTSFPGLSSTAWRAVSRRAIF